MMIVCMIHEKGARKQANSIGACGVAPHALRYAEGRGKRAGRIGEKAVMPLVAFRAGRHGDTPASPTDKASQAGLEGRAEASAWRLEEDRWRQALSSAFPATSALPVTLFRQG
jgi:hypothetical protein